MNVLDNNLATQIHVYFTFPFFVVYVARVAHLFRRLWEYFKINSSLLSKLKLLRETLFSKVVENI